MELPLEISAKGYRNVAVHRLSPYSRDTHGLWKLLTHVFPRAGGPTSTITILPEWKSRPDIVLYNCAGAIGEFFSSGRSWTPSMKVDERRRYLGEFAAISAVLPSNLLAKTSSSKPISPSSGLQSRFWCPMMGAGLFGLSFDLSILAF